MGSHQFNITNPVDSEDISLADFSAMIKGGIKYLRRRLLTIAIIGLLGALAGLLYSIFKKPQYNAVYTFVLEDDDNGGLGQYSGLASLAGIDLGAGGNGIFHGDNIIELYKSRIMIEKALLSLDTINGKPQKLIDRYIDFNKLREKWDEKPVLKNINFNGDPNKFSRYQDSIITDMVGIFNKSVLSVAKPDKKLSIIDVNVVSKDELFAKAFAESIVNTVNSFYVQTKTKKLLQNAQILQKQADSVKSVLNNSINGVASAMDASPNANPFMAVLKAPSQRRQIDVQTSSAIYAEVVKNLELSKIQLRKETPLIQAVDTPVLPLQVNKLGKIKGIVMGFMLGAFLCVCWLTGKRVLGKV